MNYDYRFFSIDTPDAIPSATPDKVEPTPLGITAHSIIEGPWSVCPPPTLQAVGMDISAANVMGSSLWPPLTASDPVVPLPPSDLDIIEFCQHGFSSDQAFLTGSEESDSLSIPFTPQHSVVTTNRSIPGPIQTIAKTARRNSRTEEKHAARLDDFEQLLAENPNSTKAIILDKLAQKWKCNPDTVFETRRLWKIQKGDPRIAGLFQKYNQLASGQLIKTSYSIKRKQREPIDLESALNVPNTDRYEVNLQLRNDWGVCRNTVRLTINDWRLNGTPECKELVRRYDSLNTGYAKGVVHSDTPVDNLPQHPVSAHVESVDNVSISASDIFDLCLEIPPVPAQILLADASIQEPENDSTIKEPTLPSRAKGSTKEEEYALRLEDFRRALDMNPKGTQFWVVDALLKLWGCQKTTFYTMLSRWKMTAEESSDIARSLQRFNQLKKRQGIGKISYAKKNNERKLEHLEALVTRPNMRRGTVSRELQTLWHCSPSVVSQAIRAWRENDTPEAEEVVRKYDNLKK